MCITVLVVVLHVQGCCHGGCIEYPSALTARVITNSVTDSSKDSYDVMCIIIILCYALTLSNFYIDLPSADLPTAVHASLNTSLLHKH